MAAPVAVQPVAAQPQPVTAPSVAAPQQPMTANPAEWPSLPSISTSGSTSQMPLVINLPPLVTNWGEPSSTAPMQRPSKVAATKATNNSDDGFVTVQRKTRREGKRTTKGMIGMSTAPTNLKVKCGRFVSAFVSRLDPSVTACELAEVIQQEHNLTATCEEVKTR